MVEHIDAQQPGLEYLFKSIFRSRDPFSDPFASSVASQVLLCPTDGYYVSDSQFDAMSSVLGDDWYLVTTETEGDPFDLSTQDPNRAHYRLSAASMGEYRSIGLGTENAIYSPAGWGLVISHELFGILGCDADTASRFLSKYGGSDDAAEFLSMFGSLGADWVDSILEVCVNGR